jgi:MFS transporter, putative metabolite:H+ symporter
VFKLPLDVSLRYGLITQAVGLLGTLICALTIDHVGRRPWFALSFAAATLALATLALFPAPTAEQVLTFLTIAYFFISTINIGVYLYTPELYPTRVRALGVGAATAWLRFASMIGPTVVGMMLAGGLPSVFTTFAIVAAIAAGKPRGAYWRRPRRSCVALRFAERAPIRPLPRPPPLCNVATRRPNAAKPPAGGSPCAYRD